MAWIPQVVESCVDFYRSARAPAKKEKRKPILAKPGAGLDKRLPSGWLAGAAGGRATTGPSNALGPVGPRHLAGGWRQGPNTAAPTSGSES